MHKRAVASVVLLLVVVAADGRDPRPRQREPGPPVVAQRPLQHRARCSCNYGIRPCWHRARVFLGVRDGGVSTSCWWTGQWWVDQIGIQEVSAAELGRKPVPYVMQTVQNQIGRTGRRRLGARPVGLRRDWWMPSKGVRIDVKRPTVYLTDARDPGTDPCGPADTVGAQAADFVLDTSLTDENVRAQVPGGLGPDTPPVPDGCRESRTLVVSLGALSATMPTEELAVYVGRTICAFAV